MEPALLVEGTTRHPVERTLVLGRGEGADLRFPHPQVSRLHARVERTERGYFLEDLESRLGTFLNGNPVTEPVRLADGDEVVLGSTLTLRFFDPAETADRPLGSATPVTLDERTGDVYLYGRLVEPPLSAAQFALMQLLLKGELVTRPELIAVVWPDQAADGISDEAVDGLVKRLRARLREHGKDPVQVVRGRGFRLR